MTHVRRSFLLTFALAGLVSSPSFAQRGPMPDSFAPVVKKTQPAVVNISTTTVRRAPRGGMPEDFFDFFGFGAPRGGGRGGREPREQRGHSLGSGVIVRPDGHMLTNNHVVEGATDITVTFSDRRELKAKIVGSDPLTDIAVLKLEGASNLPFLPMGDSSKIEIGDVVLALGNPFGIGQSVTMGIVGATGRTVPGMDPTHYADFIQTDAAINPGNSGGALVNTRGELIGINTMILSRTGGNQGIGFAVPINMARMVMEQILKTGTVSRGYMGAGIQEVTPELARGFGLNDARGVAITNVEPDSPAEKAGLRAGDIVTAINGTPVTGSNELRLRVSQTAPGSTIKLSVLREDGSKAELPVTLAQLPSDLARGGEEGVPGRPGTGGSESLAGVQVEELSARARQQLQLGRNVQGVIVSDVDPDSNAAEAGLRPGDIIQSVNRQAVTSLADFNRLVRQGGNRPIVLRVRRGEGSFFIAIDPSK